MLNLYKNRSLKNRGNGEDSSEERSVKTETLDEEEEWEKTTAESEKKSNSSKKGDADKSLEKGEETEVAEGDEVKKTPTKKVKKETAESGDEVGTDKEEGVVSGDEVEGDDKEATKEKGETAPKSRFTGKIFIKLTCIQCEIKCLTFKVNSPKPFLIKQKFNQTKKSFTGVQ